VTSRLVAFLLATVFATVGCQRLAVAGIKSDAPDVTRPSLVERVKVGVRQLGIGPDARISVRRHQGEKVCGYIAAADDATFTVVSASGVSTQIPYTDVTKVSGQNLATGWKIAIGAAIAVGVFFAVLAVVLTTQTR
jgi:hypothetical protein